MTLSLSGNELHQSAEDPEEVAYDPESSRYDLYECSSCDNVVLAVGRDEPAMSCHDQPMERVRDGEMSVKPPDIEQVLLQAFGLPKAGNDICLRVISDGPLSANEVAESMGYDRSTVTRYLNNLVDLGLLRRSELNREGGGVVYVYHSVDLEQSRRETLIGLYIWAGEAAALIEDANATKRDSLDENPDQKPPGVFWDSSGNK
ncbi:MarR family transcriptional regulator [Halapricum hydrolyticum]|uniref:MarR family transcriptional regulator n=1 Tax=Halapricum hydrolyticum TaxID=2979991 RepID=A0AAE3IBB7_9EURY|nr:MarR family transcriptional regulator [Halapricum hydrolyticum]MCU4718102.1 MarR family transcriptional regulator [Halapricum hydrolyticum]MCU4727390.1 MarR family transcriptional regulator [Halapricum hydrolyticum]